MKYGIFATGYLFFSILLFAVISHAAGNDNDLKQENLLMLFEEEEAFMTVSDFHPHRRREAPAIITLITEKQIRNMGARNLIDVLSTVPGFGMQTSQGWSRTEIEVRGISGTRNSDKVLIMVDGHKLNDPYFGGATTVTDDFPLENVKQIEIIRGPGSAIYGSNAFNAVINIVTKKAADIDGTRINAGRGSFGTSRYNLLFGEESGELSFSGNVNYFYTESEERLIQEDGLRTAGGVSETPGYSNHHRNRYDLQFNMDYRPIGFMVRYINKEQGSLVGPRDYLGDDNLFKFNELYSELQYKHHSTGKLNFFHKIYYDRFDMDFLFEIFPEGTVLGPNTFNSGALYQGTATDTTTGYNLQTDYEFSNHNLLTIGFNLENLTQNNITTKANFEPRSILPTDPDFRLISPDDFQDVSDFANYNKEANRDSTALYANFDTKIAKDVTLMAGVRYDQFSDVGSSTSPRLSMVYSVRHDLDIKLIYNEAFRAPNFDELYNRNNKGVLGNEELKPEKVRTGELGVTYWIGENYLFSVNSFYSEIKDLIVLAPTAPPRLFENRDNVRNRGIEAELKAEFSRGSYAYINYSYQEAVDENGRRLADAPAHRGNLGINASFLKYFNLHPHLFASSQRPRIEGDPRDSLDSYAVLNVALIINKFYKDMEIRANIRNALSREYVHPATGSLINDYPRQGRDFFIDISYLF